MTNDQNPATRMDTSQPMPPEAAEFARRVHGMLDGHPKDEATVARELQGFENMFDVIAAGLYTMASMLVGVKATDPSTFAAMTLIFLLVAAVASWVPAARAAGLDANTALREE